MRKTKQNVETTQNTFLNEDGLEILSPDYPNIVMIKDPQYPFVYECDVYEIGIPRNIFLVRRFPETGTIAFIDIDSLGTQDRRRLLKVIDVEKNPLASKFEEGYKLLSYFKLGTSQYVLDYFHQMVRQKKGKSLSTKVSKLSNVDLDIDDDFDSSKYSEIEDSSTQFQQASKFE